MLQLRSIGRSFPFAAAIAVAALATSSAGQSQEAAALPHEQPAPPPARPGDTDTPEHVISALYDVISGAAGQERDWNRFRSLFHPTGRMVATGTNPRTGQRAIRVMTPEEYISRSSPVMQHMGFYERQTAASVEATGHLVHIWSRYASRHAPADATPFQTGVNSIQLVNDGTRWWLLSLTWSDEPDTKKP